MPQGLSRGEWKKCLGREILNGEKKIDGEYTGMIMQER
jgi:hypothetical protein